ncbi:MAG: ribonuclease HII [Candidatus Binatia bacterium]
MKGNQGWLSTELVLPVQAGRLEEDGYAGGFQCIAGLDEVGRGPLAGPVVAAAVVLPRGVTHPDIKDSKLLTAAKRELLATWIRERAVTWGVGVVGSEEIDRTNILKASLHAMAHAFRQLHPVADYLLIDGPHKIPDDFFFEVEERPRGRKSRRQKTGDEKVRRERVASRLGIPLQRPIKGGDRLCVSIAAASIVAKVARDQLMTAYSDCYPGYGFERHKGYGCPQHLDALNRLGPSPIHRKSFRPVRERLFQACDTAPSSLFRKG